MDKINEQAQKLLDKNGNGVVPKHIWYGRRPEDYDFPSFLAVKNGKVQFEGTKAQCKRWVA